MKHINYEDIIIIVFACLIGAALIYAYAGLIISAVNPANSNYPLTTVVVKINEDSDIVTVKDYNGNLWQFKGIEDWAIGDICSMIMSPSKTEKIYDDVILSTRYNGNFSNFPIDK